MFVTMKYCLNPEDAIPVMRIFDLIGESIDYQTGTMRGVNGNDFATELAQLEALGKSKIEIHISSSGGSIIDGMVIYQAIKNCKTPTETICVGAAISMAGVILQAGKERSMTKWARLMIHNPSGGDVKELQELKEAIIDMMCPRSGLSEDQMSDIMNNTTWLNCTQSLEMKLIDKIAILHNDKEISQAQMSAKHLMQIVNQLNTQPMKGLFATLGLSDSASESEAIKAVNVLIKAKNEMDDLANKKKEAEDKCKIAEDALNKAKADLEDANNAKKELEDAKTAMEDSAKMTKAEDAVNLAITQGKIKPDTKKMWVDMYVASEADCIKLIEGMNGTRSGAKMALDSTKVPAAAKPGQAKNLSQVAETSDSMSDFLRKKREAFAAKEKAAKTPTK
jgi:ATP-dependent Clp endopeptidase proteolytic subunit ClpP